jgi:hypothetical protein
MALARATAPRRSRGAAAHQPGRTDGIYPRCLASSPGKCTPTSPACIASLLRGLVRPQKPAYTVRNSLATQAVALVSAETGQHEAQAGKASGRRRDGRIPISRALWLPPPRPRRASRAASGRPSSARKPGGTEARPHTLLPLMRFASSTPVWQCPRRAPPSPPPPPPPPHTPPPPPRHPPQTRRPPPDEQAGQLRQGHARRAVRRQRHPGPVHPPVHRAVHGHRHRMGGWGKARRQAMAGKHRGMQAPCMRACQATGATLPQPWTRTLRPTHPPPRAV